MFARAFAFLLGLVLAVSPAAAQQREFGNFTTPALVSLAAAGAGTTDSADQVNQYANGVKLNINISAKSGTIAVQVAVQGKDPVSGQYYNICQSASLTTAAFTNLTVFPGATPSANVICNDAVPSVWRVEVISGAGVAPSVTMTVSAALLVR